MSSESETELLSVLLRRGKRRGMVVLTGLPSTCKTEVAQSLARWANCPVLCIQDFLGGGGWSYRVDPDFSPPTTKEEIERQHRKAFLTLLNAAHRHLDNWVSNCVVIKASLNTAYEFQLLLKLTRVFYKFTLVIMECNVRNEYQWKSRFENIISKPWYNDSKRWSRPRSWNDIEKAVEDCAAQPPCRDLHLPHQGIYDKDRAIIWLVVDPFYHLCVHYQGYTSRSPLPNEFYKAITYLLTTGVQEFHQNPYVVDYDELRRFLFDKEINAAALKGRSEAFCHGDCVFKYREALEDSEANFCGACEVQIMSAPAYTCHFCIASLHKTCAERIHIKLLQSDSIINFYFVPGGIDGKYPCKSCQGRGREFSEECRSCLFQNRLKCHRVPTIINHDCHNHFLSLQLRTPNLRCKGCGYGFDRWCDYGCKRCAYYCHLSCALLPLVLKHEHGGHEHLMKLMFSRDGMDKEEHYWCDRCYKDMDPQVWFYSCQTCPHYAVHLGCTGAYRRRVYDPVMVKFVEQLQSQLDVWRATGNSIEL